MNHTLSRIYDETVEELKRIYTPEELWMMLDVMNGTWLAGGLMGQHISASVADSFQLYPGTYEEEWKVDRQQLESRLAKCNPWQLAVLELYCARFWEFVSGSGGPAFDSKAYTKPGAHSLQEQHNDAMKHLDEAIKKMEESRSAVKSKTIAIARTEAEKARGIIEELL